MQMSTGLPDQILLVFCTVEASDFHEERGPVQCCLQRYILASYARCRVELRVLLRVSVFCFFRILSVTCSFNVYVCACVFSASTPKIFNSAEGLHFIMANGTWNRRLSTQRQYNPKPLIFRDGGTQNEIIIKGKGNDDGSCNSRPTQSNQMLHKESSYKENYT